MPQIPKLNLAKTESYDVQKNPAKKIFPNKKINKKDLLILSADLDLPLSNKL